MPAWWKASSRAHSGSPWPFAEVDEGEREQEQGHGTGHTAGGAALAARSQQADGGDPGEEAEAARDEVEPPAVEPFANGEQLREVQGRG